MYAHSRTVAAFYISLSSSAIESARLFYLVRVRLLEIYFSTPVRKCQEHLVGQPRHSPRPLNATLDGHGL